MLELVCGDVLRARAAGEGGADGRGGGADGDGGTDGRGAASAGDGSASLERVLDRCGGLPLAVRIVAARMAGPDGPGASAFLASLDQPGGWLDELAVEDVSVRGTIHASMRVLSESGDLGALARAALLFFGRWPGGSLPATVLGVALAVEYERMAEALEHLVGLSLLERLTTPSAQAAQTSSAEPRYLPHDLVRDCAAELDAAESAAAGTTAQDTDTADDTAAANAQDEAAAAQNTDTATTAHDPDRDPVQAAFEWFEDALERSVRVFAGYFGLARRFRTPPLDAPHLPTFQDPETAISWCEAEFGNITALIRYGASRGWLLPTAGDGPDPRGSRTVAGEGRRARGGRGARLSRMDRAAAPDAGRFGQPGRARRLRAERPRRPGTKVHVRQVGASRWRVTGPRPRARGWSAS